MQTATNYWFTVEPYVYVNITPQCALLNNTLDGAIIETDNREILALLQEAQQEENCGVVYLPFERYQQKDIKDFVDELRQKYMGDIIDVALSNGKPVQIQPFCNFFDKRIMVFTPITKVLAYLKEINIHLDHTTPITKLIPFLQSLQGKPILNIMGNITDVTGYSELLSFLDQHPSSKNMVCSHTEAISLLSALGAVFHAAYRFVSLLTNRGRSPYKF